MNMSFKNKLFSRFPAKYISYKVKDSAEATEIIKGYKAIRKNNLFDDGFYLKKYPKVKASGMNPLLHYIFYGFSEGKKPNENFDGVFYKNHYPDVNINPLVHYALYGMDENRLIKVNEKDLSYFRQSNKSILFVLHEKIGTVGGCGFFNMDIIRNLPDSYTAFILTCDGEDIELWVNNSGLEKIANYDVCDVEDDFHSKKLAGIYFEILSKLNIDIVHINHLINHSFDLIDCINSKSIPFLVNLHDFYYICPSIHLIDEDCSYCNLNCGGCRWADSIEKWREHCRDVLEKSYLNIAPSNSAVEIYKNIFPQLDNFKVISHGVNVNKSSYTAELTSKPVKILVPGHISQHKGSLLIKELKKTDKNNNLELHFLGTAIPNLNKYGISHGRYERSDFNEIIAEIKPSFSLILSVCPETYSYTLTESWMAGIPVIASNLGALKERINLTNAGWLVDYRNPESIYEFILNITQKDYGDKLANISGLEFKSLKEMSVEYIDLYNTLCD